MIGQLLLTVACVVPVVAGSVVLPQEPASAGARPAVSRVDPQLPRILLARAAALVERGEYRLALKYAREAICLDAERADGFIVASSCFAGLGDMEATVRFLGLAAERAASPAEREQLLNLVEFAKRTGSLIQPMPSQRRDRAKPVTDGDDAEFDAITAGVAEKAEKVVGAIQAEKPVELPDDVKNLSNAVNEAARQAEDAGRQAAERKRAELRSLHSGLMEIARAMESAATGASTAGGRSAGPVQTAPPSTKPPSIRRDGGLRENYEDAAAQYDWAAREYDQQGKSAKANEARAKAAEYRKVAESLRSNGPRLR